MKKQVISSLIILITIFVLAGCGNNVTNDSSNNNSQNNTNVNTNNSKTNNDSLTIQEIRKNYDNDLPLGLENNYVNANGNEIVIRSTGNGFLYNMVRIIAGTLMEIGRGEGEPSDVEKIIEARDRAAAGPTAPPQGLFLIKYSFPEDI